MKLLRVFFLILCLAGVALGLFVERHAIYRLDNAAASNFSGLDFVRNATADNFMLKDGKLFAIDSLGSENAQAKDCKT